MLLTSWLHACTLVITCAHTYVVLLDHLTCAGCCLQPGANPQYADAVTYATKFRQLQGRALGLVKGRIQHILRAASQQVQAAVAEQSGGAVAVAGAPSRTVSGNLSGGRQLQLPLVLAEGAEVSLLYVRFRAAAEPTLKGVQCVHSRLCALQR